MFILLSTKQISFHLMMICSLQVLLLRSKALEKVLNDSLGIIDLKHLLISSSWPVNLRHNHQICLKTYHKTPSMDTCTNERNFSRKKDRRAKVVSVFQTCSKKFSNPSQNMSNDFTRQITCPRCFSSMKMISLPNLVIKLTLGTQSK